jgi:hypothetical protein
MNIPSAAIGYRALFAVCLLFGCLSQAHAQSSDKRPFIARVISFAELLAHKEKYNNQIVQLEGYIAIQVENLTIFSSKRDFDRLNAKQALWLRFDNDSYEKLKPLDRKFGNVVGRFRTGECNGHLCLFPGTIDVLGFAVSKPE